MFLCVHRETFTPLGIFYEDLFKIWLFLGKEKIDLIVEIDVKLLALNDAHTKFWRYSMVANVTVSETQMAFAVKELTEFVAIRSVSNPESPDYSMEHLEAAAAFPATRLQDLGFEVSLVRIEEPAPEELAPYVIAQKIVDVAKPTVLLYAHYDVQPVDRDHWTSDPFVLVERDGRLYGRGSSDDKAGIISILTMLRVYQEAGVALPVNVKILFEGEEEYGSSHMGKLLAREAKKLSANALVVLDGLNRNVKTGSLTSSTRGLVNIKLSVEALEKPVHSGIGVLAPDPAQALASLVHSLHPELIPGFTDGCEVLSSEERKILREGSITEEAHAKELGVKGGPACLRGDRMESVAERIASQPDLSIVNMNCGIPGGGNSIQDKAECTISCRILPGQSPKHIAQRVITYLHSQDVRFGLKVEAELKESASAWKADLTGPFSQAYFDSMKSTFPNATADPCGGALPLLDDFKLVFPEMELIVAGMEEPASYAHSHNESQHLGQFEDVTRCLVDFLNRAGKLPSA